MTKTVIFTVGAPCSGKTTWVLDYIERNRARLQAEGFMHINRDEVRNLITGDLYRRGHYRFDQEGRVTRIVDFMIQEFKDSASRTLIKSDTNLNLHHLREKVEYYLGLGWTVSFKTFLDVQEETLVERNRVRHAAGGVFIPPQVMSGMLAKAPGVEAYISNLIKENKANELCE